MLVNVWKVRGKVSVPLFPIRVEFFPRAGAASVSSFMAQKLKLKTALYLTEFAPAPRAEHRRERVLHPRLQISAAN